MSEDRNNPTLNDIKCLFLNFKSLQACSVHLIFYPLDLTPPFPLACYAMMFAWHLLSRLFCEKFWVQKYTTFYFVLVLPSLRTE